MSKRIQYLLKNPPTKQVECEYCYKGMINMRGMITSDDCSCCDGTGKRWKTDYSLLEKKIRKAIRSKH